MKNSARLFGAFQRSHSFSDFEGNGVGPAVAKKTVSRHGGRKWAEGKPGSGAPFYISLPWD